MPSSSGALFTKLQVAPEVALPVLQTQAPWGPLRGPRSQWRGSTCRLEPLGAERGLQPGALLSPALLSQADRSGDGNKPCDQVTGGVWQRRREVGGRGGGDSHPPESNFAPRVGARPSGSFPFLRFRSHGQQCGRFCRPEEPQAPAPRPDSSLRAPGEGRCTAGVLPAHGELPASCASAGKAQGEAELLSGAFRAGVCRGPPRGCVGGGRHRPHSRAPTPAGARPGHTALG